MGQAKRRKEQLGDAYGTPKTSGAHSMQFRYMEEDELKSVPDHLKGVRFVNVVCSIAEKEFPVAARCVFDDRSNFNTIVYGIRSGANSGRRFALSLAKTDHRALNAFILSTTDVIVYE